MKKKIFVGLGIVVVLLAIVFAYMSYRGRTLSPGGLAELTASDLKVTMPYSRPSVRGRLVFGEASAGALQPYGVYWRLGANESTEITFNQDVLFNNEKVKAGTYKIYAIPGAADFDIVLNSELGTWGYSEPDYSKDILKTKLPVQRVTTPVEQFTINMIEADGGIDISFEWADVKITLPIRKP
jgi:hypothetical protein